MNIRQFAAILLCGAAAMAGCQNQQGHADNNHAMMHDGHGGMMMNGGSMGPGMMKHENMWANVNAASATLYPTKGNTVSGTLTFTTMGNGVHVRGTVTGLAPNSTHAMHIHEFGDQSSDDGTSAGGHYNPEGHPHGAPTADQHHAGDLGNITADASGKATVDMMVNGVSIAGMTDPIVGRGVVIHAGVDDMKTQPTGNAGGRIAVGVIGVAKGQTPATMPGMTH
jgi:Cu-Zn family superoxide dismutase